MQYTPNVEYSDQQLAAIELAVEWYKTGNFKEYPIFRLTGFAGTGKTTTVKEIMKRLDVEYAMGAFSGKAAMVITKYSGLRASTIHSLIYVPVLPDKEECDRLYDLWENAEDPEQKKSYWEELSKAKEVSFELNSDSYLYQVDLLLLDECSMVNQQLLDDLLTFNVPIIAMGDPGQLPPIVGTGALFTEEPDAHLTEIHRQAKNNPIITMATKARQGIPLPWVSGEDAPQGYRSYRKGGLTPSTYNRFLLDADQIICGKHKTRRLTNQRMRELLGFDSGDLYPQVGERLICRKNNTKTGLLNGVQAVVVSRGDMYDHFFQLGIRTELMKEDEDPKFVNVLRAPFEEYEDDQAMQKVKSWQLGKYDQFDFGYAITVHLSQGSQWDNVLLLDDGMYKWRDSLKDRKKFLYTAMTRAAKNFVLIG